MRPFAWLCLVGGLLLAIPSFVIAANVPGLTPWPTLLVGICWTAFGVIVLARWGEL